jgi:hypothetical protein
MEKGSFERFPHFLHCVLQILCAINATTIIYLPSHFKVYAKDANNFCQHQHITINNHKTFTSPPFRRMSAFASKSIPPPPSISVPVYSLAAYSKSTSKTAMNIITFCTPVSVAPPKLWTISLYKNTMTKNYFFNENNKDDDCDACSTNRIGILQLLDKNQCDLVPILGKRSGYETDFSKEVECGKIGFEWTEYRRNGDDDIDENVMIENEEEALFQSIKVLPNCQSYIKVRILNTMDAGDHNVALCQVLGVGQWDDVQNRIIQVGADDVQKAKDESEVLYTGYLRKIGII